MRSKPVYQLGFTLLELSTVLVIISLLMASSMSLLVTSTQSTQYNSTVNTMNTIEQALLNYATAFGRLPCPADITQTPSTNPNYYGIEAGTSVGGTGTGECVTGMTPHANYSSAAGVEEGGVPTVALKLPDSYMYDGWGRKIRYAVDPNFTASFNLNSQKTIPNSICSSATTASDPKLITVNGILNNASTFTRSSAAVYVLLSHGANGHGAVTMSGSTFNAGSNDSAEKANCNCSNSASRGTYNAIYVQATPQYSPSTNVGQAIYYFDDIVAYKEAWQLQTPNNQSTVSCGGTVYINDQNNNNVQEFNMSGTYIRNPALSESGTYQAMTVDSSGNIWQGNSGGALKKYSPTGTLLQTVDTTQPYFSIGSVAGIAVDSVGNIFVMDNSNCVVDIFNSLGTYLTQMTGQSSASTSNCGNGNYQVAKTNGGVGDITLDAKGNLWVADESNCRFIGYSIVTNNISFTGAISGTTLTTSNMTGGTLAVGQAIFGTGVTAETVIKQITTPGSSYVVNNSQTVSSESMTAGGPVLTYLTQGGTCGVGNGQFNANSGKSDYGIAADSNPNGYVYVTDCGNNRVEKWSKAGVWQSNFGTAGASAGQMACPDIITMDSSGYLWVTQDNNKRADKFSTNGTYQNISIGPTVTGGTNFSSINMIRTFGR